MSLGRLLVQDSLASLRRSASARLRVETEDVDLAAAVLRDAGLVPSLATRTVTAEQPTDTRPEEICAALVGGGVRVLGFAVERPSLEDLFVSLTGEGFDVAR